MSSIAENKAVVAELDAIGNGSGDLSRLDALCAADMVNHALAPGRPQGIEGTRQFLAAARRSEHPGRWTESIVVAEGEMVVQFGRRELHVARRPVPRVRPGRRDLHPRRRVRLPPARRAHRRTVGHP